MADERAPLPEPLSPGSGIHALSGVALYHIHAHCHGIKDFKVGNVLCPVVGEQDLTPHAHLQPAIPI